MAQQDNKYYQGPAYFYTPEEKSYTLMQAFRENVLKSEDIEQFLFKDRLNVWATWGFPVASYFALNTTGILNRFIGYTTPYSFIKAAPIMVSAVLWLAWVNKNPVTDSLNTEKERLLQVVEKRIGVSMKRFNDVIPRYWTTQEIHRRTRQLYNQRHSLFLNILYPSEEAMGPLFDPTTYSWKYKGEKLTK